MRKQQVSRREFLKLGVVATAGVAAATAFPKFTMAQVKTVTLPECLEMRPEEMAKASRIVMDSWRYILDTVATIQDPAIRSGVQGILRNPASTLMADLMDRANREEVYQELVSKGLIKDISFDKFLPQTSNPYRSPHPFIAAPGSGYSSHHSYPGGLVSHTALNTMVSLSIYEGYKEVYGYALDRDIVIASQVLHDLHKPWVFQWGLSGESRTELKIGGTGEHHPLSVAESVTHRLPPGSLCRAGLRPQPSRMAQRRGRPGELDHGCQYHCRERSSEGSSLGTGPEDPALAQTDGKLCMPSRRS